MPEAAVHKDCHLLFAKCEVRASGQFCVTPPAGHPTRLEYAHQPKFGGGIVLSPDAGHDLGTLRLRENVGHGYITNVGTTARVCLKMTSSSSDMAFFLADKEATTSLATSATSGTTTEFPNCL